MRNSTHCPAKGFVAKINTSECQSFELEAEKRKMAKEKH